MPGKMARSDPRAGVRVIRGAGSSQHLASVLQEGRENANIDAGLGFIWRNQRQRETFDVMHSRATDSRSASKCQGKWPDQTLEQAFGLSEVLVAVSTSRLSCKRAGKPRKLMPAWAS